MYMWLGLVLNSSAHPTQIELVQLPFMLCLQHKPTLLSVWPAMSPIITFKYYCPVIVQAKLKSGVAWQTWYIKFFLSYVHIKQSRQELKDYWGNTRGFFLSRRSLKEKLRYSARHPSCRRKAPSPPESGTTGHNWPLGLSCSGQACNRCSVAVLPVWQDYSCEWPVLWSRFDGRVVITILDFKHAHGM